MVRNLFVMAIVIACLVGCHRPASGPTPVTATPVPGAKASPAPVASPGKVRPVETELHDLGDWLLLFAMQNGRPPMSLAEFTPTLTKVDPGLLAPLQSGKYVVRWGANPRGNDDPILAYEKDVPTKGGWVLWDVAVVKRESAKDFQTALSQRKK